mgnify:CR=1 FL=1
MQNRPSDLPSRRDMLRQAACGSLAWLTPWPALANARANEAPPVVVSAFLRGGADGLNLVVPELDRAQYELLRPNLALSSSETRQLNRQFGLHPA